MEQPFPADLEADIRTAYAALAGDDAELSFAVRSSATAEDLPDASFAGQQETFLNVRGIDAVLRAVREVFASLYNDRAIAYRVHHCLRPRDGGAVGRGAADGPLRRRRVRRHVHHGHRVRASTTRCSSPRRTGWARAWCRARSTRTSSTSTSRRLRAGRPAILKRGVGAKATKMVYTGEAEVGRTTEFVPVEAGRAAAAEPDRRPGGGAGPARADHRGPLRAADGHRVGPGRTRRRALHPAGPARDGEVAPVRRHDLPVPAGRAGRGGRRGPGHRPEDRRRGGPGAASTRSRWRRSGPARCWSPT